MVVIKDKVIKEAMLLPSMSKRTRAICFWKVEHSPFHHEGPADYTMSNELCFPGDWNHPGSTATSSCQRWIDLVQERCFFSREQQGRYCRGC